MENIEKECANCNVFKEYKYFSKNKTKKDGFHNICKSCHKIYMSKYVIINSEKIKKNSKIYKLNNSDKLKEQDLVYKELNKDRISEYSKQYRKDNFESLKDKDKLWKKKTGYEKSEKRKEYKRNWQKKNRLSKPWYYAHRDIVNSVIRRIGIKKETDTITELGYSSLDLKLHLEMLFVQKMVIDIDYKI